MTPASKRRPWRKALALGAVLAVLAGVVIGTWFRPAVITPAAPITPVAGSSAPLATPSPEAATGVLAQVTPQTGSGSHTAEPAPNTDATPVTQVESSDASDLSRLRARSLALPVNGINAAQLSDTYTQARAAGAPHEAIDIMAVRGTPVLAVEDGRVAKLFLSKPDRKSVV